VAACILQRCWWLSGFGYLVACHSNVVPEPQQCGRHPPAASEPMTPANYDALVGDFTLIQVSTNQGKPAPQQVRAIHLYANDSLHRYRYEVRQIGRSWGERPVAGWVVTPGNGSAWSAMTRSRDPENPGIQWTAGRLRLGQVDVMDGVGEDLKVTAVSSNGFWGTWTMDLGIAVIMDSATGRVLPAEEGYFCALRGAPSS
jgi:hypothetical protein